MSPLRPYQIESGAAVLASLELNRSVVMQQPTGAGKTRSALQFFQDEPGVIWFVCHRRELVRQASLALSAAGIPHAVAAPGFERDPLAKVQVCSVGSMRRRLKRYPSPRRIIFDECHHIAARTWCALMDEFPQAKVIGLTATPTRGDRQGLHNWFDDLVVGPSIASLIADGYLSPYRLFAPSRPDLSAVPLKRGDYEHTKADEVMRDPRIVGDAVLAYQTNAAGKRAVVFATSVAASLALVERFNDAGIPARHVDGKTPLAKRDAAVADLASGTIRILSNYGVFTEGFDLPAIDAVILLRPTRSQSLYLQMIGRGLRTSPGKQVAIILDHAGLVFEHGFPDAPIEWTLAGGATRSARPRKPRVFACPKCGRAHKPAPACPSCGHRYTAATLKEAAEGVLEEQRADAAATQAQADEAAHAERIIADAMASWLPVAAIARITKRTPTQVARMVSDGLPANEAGEIQVSAALAWVEAHPVAKRARRAPVKVKKKGWRIWLW